MHIMRNKNTKKDKNGGFTIVEVLAVFTLMLILASVSVIGVLSYQDYADYKRQNNYAQTLFLAAQTKLVAYSETGQLEELQEISVQELELSEVIMPDGRTADQNKKEMNVKSHTIYYLTGNKQNYEAYCRGEYSNRKDAQSRGYQALYDIFEEFIYDRSILEGTIALEYNPTDGLVYSVLYSDKCGSFTYKGNTVNGVVNVLNRTEDVRSERMIGYYGLD